MESLYASKRSWPSSPQLFSPEKWSVHDASSPAVLSVRTLLMSSVGGMVRGSPMQARKVPEMDIQRAGQGSRPSSK